MGDQSILGQGRKKGRDFQNGSEEKGEVRLAFNIQCLRKGFLCKGGRGVNSERQRDGGGKEWLLRPQEGEEKCRQKEKEKHSTLPFSRGSYGECRQEQTGEG